MEFKIQILVHGTGKKSLTYPKYPLSHFFNGQCVPGVLSPYVKCLGTEIDH